MSDLTDRFIDALDALHSDRTAEPMSQLFSDDATLAKVGIPHTQQGRDGAETFWTEYREVFGDIEDTFGSIVEDEKHAVLEWTSQGTLSDGSPLDYGGVSVLDTGDEQITGFRTYYDSAVFRRQDADG